MQNKISPVIKNERNHFKYGISSTALYSNLVLSHGEGVHLFDENGKKYLDLFAGAGIASLGHSHSSFVETMKLQLDKLIVGSYTTKNRSNFITSLFRLLPKELSQISFFSAGTEANEAAIKLARNYTGKYQIVSFWGGYHGRTSGVLSLSDPSFADPTIDMISGTIRVPYPDTYRRTFDGDDEVYLKKTINFLETAIARSSSKGVAAIIVEPVQGTSGNVFPVKGFLRELKVLTKKHNCLLIIDEIITGFGRTGSFFRFQEEDVAPDILVIGKGMANGIPLSAVIASEKIASNEFMAKPSALSSSFGGNPFSLTAAKIAIEIIEKEKLVENSKKVGAIWLQMLQKELSNIPIIGDIRGSGLMLAIELVTDKATKNPIDSNLCSKLFDSSIKQGIIGSFRSPHIRLNPPLVFSEADAEEATTKIKRSINELL